MTSPYQIVQLASLGQALDEELARRYSVLPLWQERDFLPRFAEAPQSQILITSALLGLKRPWLEALPAVKAVCSWGVGYENFDMQAARELGVVVSNTPDVLDNCVADMAWALMFGVARRTSQGDRFVKTGQWTGPGRFPMGTRVSGKKLGVVGLGRIGLAIAKRGAGFDMEVRYHNRRERPEAPYAYEASLVELAQWADFLILACPGGPETRHIANREVLRALGPQGILVNIARGSVVDDEALITALRNGELGGAGLDVFTDEPRVPAALLDMDNVSLMPHVSSNTRETRRDLGQCVMDNILSYMETGRLVTPLS